MSESLTPFEGENLASYEALRTAILLADGFTLIFAVTNTEEGAQEVMRHLWRDGVRYQKAWLRDPERPLIDQVVESARTKQPVMVLGLEGLTTVGEQMGRSLRNLNWTRPQWTARLPQTIVFWVTADMEADLAREAPDLWRFRSLRVEFAFGLLPRAARAVEIRKRLRAHKFAPRIRLAALIELFSLTRDQGVLLQAVQLVAQTPTLSRLEEFERLERLSLSAFQIDDGSLERIGPLPNLARLSLFYTETSDRAVGDFLRQSKPRSLDWVSIIGAQIGPATFIQLANLKSVEGLTIASTGMNLGELRRLAKFRKLSFLQINESLLSDKEIELVSQAKSLDTLLVPRCLISDAGIPHLARLKRLHRLSLRETQITSASLAIISQLIELRNLDLSFTSVTDESIELLATLPKLKTVDLEETWVTKEAASRLRHLFAVQRRKVEVLL